MPPKKRCNQQTAERKERIDIEVSASERVGVMNEDSFDRRIERIARRQAGAFSHVQVRWAGALAHRGDRMPCSTTTTSALRRCALRIAGVGAAACSGPGVAV